LCQETPKGFEIPGKKKRGGDMEPTKIEKVGIHASILFLAMVARNHNQRGKKWFHKALSGLYLGVEIVEAICILNDLRGKE